MINIKPGALVSLPLGDLRFKMIAGTSFWLLDPETGKDVFMPEKTFNGLYNDGKVVIHGAKPANGYDKTGALGPDEALKDFDFARAWFVRQWDKTPSKLSDKALRTFTKGLEAPATRAGVKVVPSPGTLRKAIRLRGEVDYRPSAVIISRTGKAPRASRVGAIVDEILRRSVAWFWSARGRLKCEAHAFALKLIARADRLGAQVHKHQWETLWKPFFETVRERINAAECRDTWTEKYSAREAQQRFEGTAPIFDPDRVMQTVMIDATVVDGWCVWRDQDDVLIPLGRPTLYLAVDVKSRMVVNWFLSYEPPSLYGAMALLKRVVSPNEHGVWGKPNEIILDCGWENTSPSIQEALASAGISVHWAPVRTPEYKAIVERAFFTLNKLVFHKMMGGSVSLPPHLMSRIGLKPSETASIELEQLDELLTNALRVFYPNRVHKGIERIPQVVWNEGIEGRRRGVADLAALVAHFGQTETVTLKREGITLKDGLRFYDREAVTRLLDDLAMDTKFSDRRKGSATAKVKAVVNPEDVTFAQVWNPRRKRMEILHNLHPTFAKGVSSRWEYRMLKEFAKSEDAAFITEEQQLMQLAALRTLIESMTPDLRAKAMKRRQKLLGKKPEGLVGHSVARATAPGNWQGNAPVDPPDDGSTAASAAHVVTSVAASTNVRDGVMVKGVRRGGKKAIEKAKKTIAEKKAAAETAKAAQEATIKAPQPPTSSPYAKGIARIPKPGAPDPAQPSADDIEAILNRTWVKGDANDRKDKK